MLPTGYGCSVMELGLQNINASLVPYDVEPQNLLVIGKRRTGKSTLLTNLALGMTGSFVVVGDDLANQILARIPKERQHEVLYFNPSLYPFAFNFLSKIESKFHALYASIIMDAVKGVWGYDVPTPTLDQYLRGTLLTLLASPGETFLTAKFLLTDKKYRKTIVHALHDPFLKDFWKDYESLTPKEQRTDTASTLNKLRAFAFEPVMRSVLDQKDNKLSFKDRIVLVSLSEADLGTENARLLGALVLASLHIQGLRGLTTTLFVDDAYRYGGAVGRILSCPSIHTVFATPSLDLFQKSALPSILGATSATLAFTTTAKDAKLLEPEFNLTNDQYPLSRIPYGSAYFQEGDKALHLYIEDMLYPFTGQERKIMDRCISQCTQPIETIVKRSGRFFA